MSGFLGMMFTGGGGSTPAVTPSAYIAYGGATTSKRITVYPWNSTSGFGTAFTTPSVTAEVHEVSFVTDNSNISASTWVAPYLNVWQWSGLGFGTKYADPASQLNPASNGPTGYTWTNNLNAILTVNNNVPSYPQAWAWSTASGFGSKYANGSLLTSGNTPRGITLNADSSQVAFQIFSSGGTPGNPAAPAIALYPWSGGFGTRYASPSSLPAGYPLGEIAISFNKVTNDLICGTNTAPFLYAYPVTSAGFGTKYSNPSVALSTAVNSLKFSGDGATIATVNLGSPTVNAYQWGAGFGTKYANPVSAPAYAFSMDWSSTSNAIATGQKNANPYTAVFAWTSGGFGAKYSDPGTFPGTASYVSFANQSR